MNLSVDDIVGKHDKFLKKIGIQMLDKNRNLPYWGGCNPKKPYPSLTFYRVGVGFFWVLLGFFGFFWVLLIFPDFSYTRYNNMHML